MIEVTVDLPGGSTSVEVTPAGVPGPTGKSAYQVAVDEGFEGSEVEWLASLEGASGAPGVDGKSAYDVAVDGGFEGTEEEWLESLVGEDGDTGPQGDPGSPGADGDSAYEVAVENGFSGNEEEWLESLVGPQGNAGSNGSAGSAGVDGKTIRNGTGAPAGGLGVDGDFYIDTTADTIYGPKTAGSWGSPTSLVGPQGDPGEPGDPGDPGADGESAYDIAVDNGFEGTEEEWLAALNDVPGIDEVLSAGSNAVNATLGILDTGRGTSHTSAGLNFYYLDNSKWGSIDFDDGHIQVWPDPGAKQMDLQFPTGDDLTGIRVVTLPDETGTLATREWVASTAQDLQSVLTEGNTAVGLGITLEADGDDPANLLVSGPTSGIGITPTVVDFDQDGTSGLLSADELTDGQTWTLPDQSGTIALLTDIPSAQEVRHDTAGGYDYTGVAPEGTAEGSSGWTVTRITLTSPPVVTHGSGTWTGRAGLSYS